MAKKFNTKEIVITDPKRSSIDMSASVKGTGKLGRLIPVFSQELLPNTTVHYTPNTLARFVPLAAPLMSNMTIRHHIIAVPLRQLYNNWEDLITGGEYNTNNEVLGHFTLNELYDYVFSRLITEVNPDPKEWTPDVWFTHANTTWKNIFTQLGYGSVYDQEVGVLLDKVLKDSSITRWTPELQDLYCQALGVITNMFIGSGSIMDYLGYPVRDWTKIFAEMHNDSFSYDTETKIPTSFEATMDGHTMLSDGPLRAYYRIWYYYFRDQNIDVVGAGFTPEDLAKYDGDPLSDTDWIWRLIMPRTVAWSKDLFNTTTLQAYENNAFVPTTKNGEIGNEPVEKKSLYVYDQKTGNMRQMEVPAAWTSGMFDSVKNSKLMLRNQNIASAGITGFSLKNLQKVEALSRWLDKNLFAGWCYADQLSSHFGVRYSDARLQLPEYVGGTKSQVACQTLTNTTNTTEDVAGSQSAYAQGITANDSCSYFAEEHCYLFDMMSIVPELSYKYATPKHLLHLKKFDFAFPEFAQLGCDIVPKMCVASSLQYSGVTGVDNLGAFAYADRYFEYKNNINRLTGKLVDDLDLYTFTQDYGRTDIYGKTGQVPTLNPDFIHCVPSVDCFVSDSIEYEFMFDHLAEVKANIPLPVVEYV